MTSDNAFLKGAGSCTWSSVVKWGCRMRARRPSLLRGQRLPVTALLLLILFIARSTTASFVQATGPLHFHSMTAKAAAAAAATTTISYHPPLRLATMRCPFVLHCKNQLGQKAKDDDDDSIRLARDLSKRAEEINIHKERKRLEKQNTLSFLKRRPVKLKYEDARRWVQANLGADTKEEYDDLVANGNLRTPYIPKRPEEYYKSTREWISWDHFLKGKFDKENPSCIKPPTGVFD